MATRKTSEYSESSIQVLKGLEPVRQRPGMYTRTDNPLHIIQEVLDNASDEALGGYGKHITVTMHTDGSVSVEDDGRGIPVGMHPSEKLPVVEIVFTQLHAGGKFEKGSGGAYAFSGGLHGVGVSVTNALSKRLEVIVWRDGQVSTLTFADGKVIEKLKTKGSSKGDKSHGTSVRAWPDGKYFDSATIPMPELIRLLRSKAVLLPGVKVTLIQEKSGDTQTWQYAQGLRGYLNEAIAQAGHGPEVIPPFEGEQYATGAGDEDSFAEGEGAAWVVSWTEDGAPVRESYVNLIPTPAGGTHESGLREGLFNAVKGFIEMHALQPKGVKLMPEDVFARASFILSAKVLDPQFQGQIKERLNSRDAVRLVSAYVKSALELWLNQHVDYGRKLADLVIKQAQARTRAGQKVEKKKSSGVAVLPGKLTDCESQDIVLNTWEAERDRLFANNEVHDIAVAIGVDPHGANDNPDLSNLRYGKVCILSDADVDGSHIQVLLLTLFYKHFPKLIELGHIHISRPPLFRVDAPARGKKPAQKIYALDANELQAIEDKLRKDGVKESGWQISRFKGLGEMSAEQLWDTTLNPDTRRLLPVTLGSWTEDETFKTMDMLMGKSESGARRDWLEERGNEVEADI
jgi:topoisomerase-4 subunit B